MRIVLARHYCFSRGMRKRDSSTFASDSISFFSLYTRKVLATKQKTKRVDGKSKSGERGEGRGGTGVEEEERIPSSRLEQPSRLRSLLRTTTSSMSSHCHVQNDDDKREGKLQLDYEHVKVAFQSCFPIDVVQVSGANR